MYTGLIAMIIYYLMPNMAFVNQNQEQVLMNPPPPPLNKPGNELVFCYSNVNSSVYSVSNIIVLIYATGFDQIG